MNFRDLKVLCYADVANYPGLPEIFKGKGGLPMSAWQITAAKQRLGSEQFLFTKIFTTERVIEGVKIYPINTLSYLPFPGCPPSNPKAPQGIVFPPELFSLGLRQIQCRLLSKVFSQAIKTERPSVIHLHRPRRSNMPIIETAIRSGIPVAVTLHGLGLAEREWQGWKQSESDRQFDKTLIEFLNKERVAITCVGEVIKNKILSLLDVKYPEMIFATKNGVDKEIFRFFTTDEAKTIRQEMSVPEDTRIISTVGTLDRRKNFEFLVRAVKILREKTGSDIQCWIVGKGNMKRKLSDLIASLGLNGKVFLMGEKTPHEIARIFAASDLSVLVSHSEGLSRTIFESISVGTPAASFKDLFSENLAKDAQSGLFLTDRGNGGSENFADFLAKVLQRKWDRTGVVKASKGYSWDDVGKDYLEILSEVAEQAN